MLQEWKKVRKKYISLQENLSKLFNNHLSLKDLKKKVMKLFIWSIQLMSTLFNNWKNLMEKNWKIVLKKEWILKRLKKKKRKKKNKKQNLKDYAKLLKKSLVIKLKKLLFQQELKIHHVFWLLVNTAGLPIWKELWKHKH